MKKKLPGELRKEKARIAKGREIFKQRNKEKAATIKRLIDEKEEVESSREKWRHRFRDAEKEKAELEKELQSAKQALVEEQQLSAKLRYEIEMIKKKTPI